MKQNEDIRSVDQIKEFDALKNYHLNLMLSEIKIKIEQADYKLRNSHWRKEEGYYANGYVTRTLLTSEGILTFKRTKFKIYDSVKNKWRTRYLLDDYLQIEKNQKLSYEFQLKILEKIAQGMRPKDIIQCFPRASINKTTISRLVNKINVVDLNLESSYQNYEIPKNVEKFNNIYISTDDAFLKLKEKQQAKEGGQEQKYSKGAKYRVRLAILYQGVSKEPDARGSRLINKRIVYKLERSQTTDNKKFAQLCREKIIEFYGNKNWNIVVCGDGDSYIKEMTEELGGEIVLDWFHLKMKLRKCFSFTHYKKNSLGQKVFEILSEVLKVEPILFIENYLIPLTISGFLKEKETKELINYIKTNIKGIKAYNQSWYNGCFTESNVYHFVKKISNGRSYSVKSFSNLIALKVGWINTLKPIDVWKTQTEEKMIYKLQLNKFPNFTVKKNFKTSFNHLFSSHATAEIIY